MLADVTNPTGKHRRKRRHHGEGTVIERRDRWRARPWAAVVPFIDESGRRREKWLSASSRDEAEALRRDFLRRLSAGMAPASLERTLAAHMADWLVVVRDQLSPATFDRYRQHIAARIDPTLGHLPLGAVTVTHVRAAMATWEGKPSTLGGTLIVLRAALRMAHADNLIGEDPTRGVKAPRKAPYTAVILDVAAARRLIDVADGEPYRDLLVTILGLGLRRGEALAVRTTDVDFTGGYLRVAQSLRRIPADFRAEGEASRRFVPPKAGSFRAVPLPAFVSAAIRHRIAERDAEKRSPYAHNDLVFCDPHGNAVPFTNLDDWFKAMLAKAGLPDMRLHDLRHSAATMLLAEGVPERTVQDILGHRSGEMTRRYMSVLPRMTRDAADRLDKAMGG